MVPLGVAARARDRARLFSDFVMIPCPLSYQSLRTPPGKLLKSRLLICNNRSHNAEVVSSSLTLVTNRSSTYEPSLIGPTRHRSYDWLM
jgi:hypothetical protein